MVKMIEKSLEPNLEFHFFSFLLLVPLLGYYFIVEQSSAILLLGLFCCQTNHHWPPLLIHFCLSTTNQLIIGPLSSSYTCVVANWLLALHPPWILFWKEQLIIHGTFPVLLHLFCCQPIISLLSSLSSFVVARNNQLIVSPLPLFLLCLFCYQPIIGF